jgi:hypothetical protein
MKSYRPTGLFPIAPGSALPSRTGLFGTLLSAASLNSIGDQERASFEFKASFRSGDYLQRYGMPYDYRNDGDYLNKFHWAVNHGKKRQWNLEFLSRLKQNKLALVPEFLVDLDALNFSGPMQAPHPEEDSDTAYVYPAYVMWNNDPSYMSFLGSLDRLELPKDVLRKTGGHPQSHLRQSPDYRLRPRHGWTV